jgi:GTPase SAR1 family protein
MLLGMEIVPLNTPEGLNWLQIEDGNQSGPEWLRRSINLRLNNISFKNINTFLPNPIHTYTNIISLNVSNNLLLESLPVKALCNMANLKELHCLNCPLLISPPLEVCSLGGFEVMNFLREVVVSGTLSKSMVLFFIGNGESGKTSALQALKSTNNLTNKISIDKRTIGIDISSLNLMDEFDINFHIYDMAGQNIYKDTHTYFVGRRAIYLFVWKLKNITDTLEEITNSMKEMIESWVNTLQYRIPGASILFVATHADCVTEEDIKSQSLLIQQLVLEQIKKYSSTCLPIRILNNGESLIIDSISGRGISDLRSNIALFGKSLPWYDEPIPRSWVDLENKLQDKLYNDDLKFLAWDAYEDLCRDCGIDKSLQKSCTTFMHETGKIRYFGLNIKENKNRVKKLISNNRKSSLTDKIKKKISISIFSNDKGGDNSYEIISDESIEKSLNDTVFISPSWVCDILKGVIRHDRDLLLRYFLKCNDLVMVRRVKHSISHGIIHDSIVNYLWPSKILSSSKSLSSSSLEYWNEANLSENESDVWVENVIKSRGDISRALSILVGFDLISLKGKKLIVPVLLKKGKVGNSLINVNGNYNLINCPYVSLYEYTGLPGGFFERISIRMTKWSFHTDIGSNITISYLLGNIGQIQLYKSSNGNSMFSIQSTSRYYLQYFFLILG